MFNICDNYASIVGEEHRKNFGQFFTDARVAEFMVEWVVSGGARSLYDPAFGLGAFYYAAKSKRYDGEFRGSEIDPKIFSFFQKNEKSFSYKVENSDYLSIWGGTYPAIVCNPPYMRFQKFQGRDSFFLEIEKNMNVKLSGYTNIASAFLVKSINELMDGGRLAYIMPLEFLNTGYGKIIKRQLIEQGTLHAIIKLDCEKDVFPEVTTSVGILLFEKRRSLTPVKFFIARNISCLEGLLSRNPVTSIDAKDISPDEKWLRFFDCEKPTINSNQLVPLSNYGSFSRGIATGANEFFVLDKAQIASLGLSKHEYIPCITKSSQITKAIFADSELTSLIDANASVFLVNINGRPSNEAAKYIAQGEQMDFHTRYLTKKRNPWYKIENRFPSPLFFGVFSRGRFKVIRNYSNTLCLTCYHGFQPNIFGRNYIDHLFLYFLSSSGKHILSQNMRKYGDSLDKFEPNDLNDALCPSIEWFQCLKALEIAEEMNYIKLHNKLSENVERLFETLIDKSSQQADTVDSLVLNYDLIVH